MRPKTKMVDRIAENSKSSPSLVKSQGFRPFTTPSAEIMIGLGKVHGRGCVASERSMFRRLVEGRRTRERHEQREEGA